MKKQWTIDELNEAFGRGSELDFTDKQINEDTRRTRVAEALVGKKPAWYNKERTKEHARKISENRKQRVETTEQRERRLAASIAVTTSPTHRDRKSLEMLERHSQAGYSQKVGDTLKQYYIDHPEARQQRSSTLKEALADPAVRAKMSAASLGKPKPRATCPHCGKEGGINGIKRYHFDNCKLKP
jgi:hypothetical protein